MIALKLEGFLHSLVSGSVDVDKLILKKLQQLEDYSQGGFLLSVQSNSHSIIAPSDWCKKTSRQFLSQSEVRPKPMVIRLGRFSRTSRRLRVFASSLIGSLCFLCSSNGQCDCFYFVFTTLISLRVALKLRLIMTAFFFSVLQKKEISGLRYACLL